MCCSIERAAMVQESQLIEVRTPNLQKANPTRHEPSRRKCRWGMRTLLKFMRGTYMLCHELSFFVADFVFSSDFGPCSAMAMGVSPQFEVIRIECLLVIVSLDSKTRRLLYSLSFS
jgi:hypothetical protein